MKSLLTGLAALAFFSCAMTEGKAGKILNELNVHAYGTSSNRYYVRFSDIAKLNHLSAGIPYHYKTEALNGEKYKSVEGISPQMSLLLFLVDHMGKVDHVITTGEIEAWKKKVGGL